MVGYYFSGCNATWVAIGDSGCKSRIERWYTVLDSDHPDPCHISSGCAECYLHGTGIYYRSGWESLLQEMHYGTDDGTNTKLPQRHRKHPWRRLHWGYLSVASHNYMQCSNAASLPVATGLPSNWRPMNGSRSDELPKYLLLAPEVSAAAPACALVPDLHRLPGLLATLCVTGAQISRKRWR